MIDTKTRYGQNRRKWKRCDNNLTNDPSNSIDNGKFSIRLSIKVAASLLSLIFFLASNVCIQSSLMTSSDASVGTMYFSFSTYVKHENEHISIFINPRIYCLLPLQVGFRCLLAGPRYFQLEKCRWILSVSLIVLACGPF